MVAVATLAGANSTAARRDGFARYDMIHAYIRAALFPKLVTSIIRLSGTEKVVGANRFGAGIRHRDALFQRHGVLLAK